MRAIIDRVHTGGGYARPARGEMRAAAAAATTTAAAAAATAGAAAATATTAAAATTTGGRRLRRRAAAATAAAASILGGDAEDHEGIIGHQEDTRKEATPAYLSRAEDYDERPWLSEN